MNERLTHDCAVALAHALLEVVEACLTEAERRAAYDRFYLICKAGLDSYQIQQDRLQQRLRPTRN